MTTYNTGNPLGSSDPRDLFDNAENLDNAVNTQVSDEWVDRRGVTRKTFKGMENDFQSFLLSSGYEDLGAYQAGIQVTARNQIILSAGEYWRASASTALPYTTTGAGMPESGAFVVVGDAVLRQQLAAPGGAGLVAGGVVMHVDTIANLLAIDTSQLPDGQQAIVAEYHAGTGGGGGVFCWDADSVEDDNGGTVTQVDGVAVGRWKRPFAGIMNAEQWGAGTTKTAPENRAIIQAAIDYCTEANASAGTLIVVPKSCEYGYDFGDPTTYLTKGDVNASCVVEDFTTGFKTNSGGLKPWGGQRRLWMFAPGEVAQNEENTGIGNTAGNSTLIHGEWNPGLIMQVNGQNIDNRRVKIFFGGRGVNYWSIGQGNMTIPYAPGTASEDNGTNEQRRRHFNIAGKTGDAAAYQNKYVIRQDTGFQGWNLQEPLYPYHFRSVPDATSTLTAYFENQAAGQGVQLVLKSANEQVNISQDNSAGGRLLFKNTAGENAFQIKANGEVAAKNGINGGAFTTTARNALANISYGSMLFDTTLNKPVWYSSPGVWRDATGTAV